MARSDGARQWAVVLSELAGVRVVVDWERPVWRVRWMDGPTRPALMDRAAALARYRVGAPLTVPDMRLARSSSGQARALVWLTLADEAGRADTIDRVEQLVEDTGYPPGARRRGRPGRRGAAEPFGRRWLCGHGSPAGRCLPPGPAAAVGSPSACPGGRGGQLPVAGRRPAGRAAGKFTALRTPRALGRIGIRGPSAVRAVQRTTAGDAWSWSAAPVLRWDVPRSRPPRRSPRGPTDNQ